MADEYIPAITKRWLAPLLVLTLLSWVGLATAAATLDEQLIEAARSGDLGLVSTLLTDGAVVNAKDPCGQTALMWAAKEGHTEIVQLLLGKNADVHARDEQGRTALMWAARELYANTMKLLLEKGANANAEDRNGETALTLAIQFFGYDLMTQMEKCCPLERGEKDCPTDGMRPPWLRERQRAEVMKLLQTQGAAEVLIVAATRGDRKEIQRLLDAGADIRAKATNGVTALMMAVEWGVADKVGNADVARLFLDKGADVNSQDNYGWTALTRAVPPEPGRYGEIARRQRRRH